MIVSLQDLSMNDVNRAGAKAVNMARLLQKGYRVPPGIVLTTSGVEMMNEDGGVTCEELVSRTHTICGFPLAVRSTAVGEDGEKKSYAGVFKSYLNVIDSEGIITAVCSVVKSAYAATAQQYDDQGLSMAVIIQRFIDADVSGVLFTANPITSRDDEIVVEYFNGLGSSIVGGLCTPNHGVYRKQDRSCLFFQKSSGGMSVRSNSGQSGTCQVKISGSEVAVLDEDVMLGLLQEACAIERELGYPVDLEWAVKGSELYILQARPITHMRGI